MKVKVKDLNHINCKRIEASYYARAARLEREIHGTDDWCICKCVYYKGKRHEDGSHPHDNHPHKEFRND